MGFLNCSGSQFEAAVPVLAMQHLDCLQWSFSAVVIDHVLLIMIEFRRLQLYGFLLWKFSFKMLNLFCLLFYLLMQEFFRIFVPGSYPGPSSLPAFSVSLKVGPLQLSPIVIVFALEQRLSSG